MIKKISKLYLQQKKRFLKKVIGTSIKPRLAVFRSHKHIYAQIIDDQKGQTLAASSTVDKLLKEKLNNKTATQDAAFLIGETLAEKAIQKNITKIVFDRGDRPYHGRIKKVAEGARNSGLIF